MDAPQWNGDLGSVYGDRGWPSASGAKHKPPKPYAGSPAEMLRRAMDAQAELLQEISAEQQAENLRKARERRASRRQLAQQGIQPGGVEA